MGSPLFIGSMVLLVVVVSTAYLIGAKAARAVRGFREEEHVSFTHRSEP